MGWQLIGELPRTEADEIALLKGEIAALRAELSAVKSAPIDVAMLEAMVSVELSRQTAGIEQRAAESAAVRAAQLVPQPVNGKDGRDGATLPELMEAIAAEVSRVMDAAYKPKDGEPGPPGKDGSSVSLEQVASLVQSALPAEVERAMSRVPVPKDGAAGRDGTSIASMLIDQQGHLVVTLSDGQVRDVGEIRGPAGADGADGLGFDDLSVDPVATERVMTLRFQRGERVKAFPVTLQGFLLHRGTYEPGRTYEPGDCVTRDGGTWHATASTAERPGSGATAWQLIVKRGDPGRPGQAGADGAPGRDGRDLTQVRFDGGKH